MLEEEKEAIRYLKQIQQDFLNSAKQRRENGEDTGYGTLEDVDKLSAFEIGIVLNLIKKQQEEIEKKDKLEKEVADDIDKVAVELSKLSDNIYIINQAMLLQKIAKEKLGKFYID